MNYTSLFFKVDVEHDAAEGPERIAEEIRRRLLKMYGVRDVELSNFTASEQ
jgi:hypothetical protein